MRLNGTPDTAYCIWNAIQPKWHSKCNRLYQNLLGFRIFAFLAWKDMCIHIYICTQDTSMYTYIWYMYTHTRVTEYMYAYKDIFFFLGSCFHWDFHWDGDLPPHVAPRVARRSAKFWISGILTNFNRDCQKRSKFDQKNSLASSEAVCCSVLEVWCSAVFFGYSRSNSLCIIYVVCLSVLKVCCSTLFFPYSRSPLLSSPFSKRWDPKWSSGFKTESWMVEVEVFFQMSRKVQVFFQMSRKVQVFLQMNRITRELWWSFKDSNLYLDDHFESHLFGNGLYICSMLQCVELCCRDSFFVTLILM